MSGRTTRKVLDALEYLKTHGGTVVFCVHTPAMVRHVVAILRQCSGHGFSWKAKVDRAYFEFGQFKIIALSDLGIDLDMKLNGVDPERIFIDHKLMQRAEHATS